MKRKKHIQLAEEFGILESLEDFCQLLNNRLDDLDNLPCAIVKFTIRNYSKQRKLVEMEVVPGSPAAREMTKEFSAVLGRKVYVYRSPETNYRIDNFNHYYIVSPEPIKNIKNYL